MVVLRDVSIASIHSKFCLIVRESCGLGTCFFRRRNPTCERVLNYRFYLLGEWRVGSVQTCREEKQKRFEDFEDYEATYRERKLKT